MIPFPTTQTYQVVSPSRNSRVRLQLLKSHHKKSEEDCRLQKNYVFLDSQINSYWKKNMCFFIFPKRNSFTVKVSPKTPAASWIWQQLPFDLVTFARCHGDSFLLDQQNFSLDVLFAKAIAFHCTSLVFSGTSFFGVMQLMPTSLLLKNKLKEYPNSNNMMGRSCCGLDLYGSHI